MMKLIPVLFFLLSVLSVKSQCQLEPLIEGPGQHILCPTQTITLETQEYDAYQWYKRPAFGGPAEPIAGETGQSYTLSTAQAINYISVQVTQDTCTEMSNEVFIDAWAFLPVTVISEGPYYYQPDTGFIICEFDSIVFTLGQGLDTNIVWTRNGVEIQGATKRKLVVYEAGIYHVSAAYSICPNDVFSLGVSLPVFVKECETSYVSDPVFEGVKFLVYPNPVRDRLYLTDYEEMIGSPYAIYSEDGRNVRDGVVPIGGIDLDCISAGFYLLHVELNNSSVVRKFIVE